jgi:hypothetical protein
MKTILGRPRLRGRLIAGAITATAVIGGFATDVHAGSSADVDIEYDCAAGTATITSTKDSSNVVVSVNGVETKTDELTGQTYVVDLESLENLDTIWVKSGNNATDDGPGYGQRFEFDYDATCDPDADGDGYPRSADCNDSNAAINPGVPDIPNNDIDENCDGADLIVGDGQIRVTLIWGNDDDLDLFVTDPTGERVWYRNRTAASGGTLDRDDNINVCGTDAEPGGVENTIWPNFNTTGTYTVQLSSFRDCQVGTATTYTIQVFVDSQLVHTETGTVDSASGTGDTVVDTFTFTVV